MKIAAIQMVSAPDLATNLAMATPEFAADLAGVSAYQAADHADGLFGFQEAVNLVSFFSAEVLIHLATWTWRFEWQ